MRGDAIVSVAAVGGWLCPLGAGLLAEVRLRMPLPVVAARRRRSVPKPIPRIDLAELTPRVSTEAIHAGARANVTCVTPLGDETASTS